jgi:hypothetical protein
MIKKLYALTKIEMGIFDLNLSNDFLDELESQIKNSQNTHGNGKIPFIQSFMTDYNIVNNPSFCKLKNHILNPINSNNENILDFGEVKIRDMWGIIMNKGEYIKPHSHLPSFLSFILYIKCSQNSSKVIFETMPKFKVKPKVGRLLIFPSYIKHSVEKSKSNSERISIAGNIIGE